ncbi:MULTISPECIES: PPOX class F420-dependent oxidoreductase [unclassified Micromonospora]|uniref:PPOX class F420-dependent oxidoreductase n=1 Tax=Micromonospora TaxID=1873 RepID=UPI00098D2E0D|nr:MULTISPECIES: PPOX class F420-dependent oxidoreductase [unclassified Micromonospora]MDI5938378.1 PPOX class F420-dependent oxidoreductase [Micromonospora sp. DH15]OON32978.1 PPOX class F420-dependent enzyme [Micromonospora sp. Rc5]
MTTLDRLGAEKYVLLTTFRKDGRPVPTPVWVVRDGDALAAWTVADSGKVKRIRRSGEVTVAPCDVRGRPHGAAVPGRAAICDPAQTRRIRELLKQKYRLVGRLSLLGSRLRRGEGGTVGIRVILTEGAAPGGEGAR